MSLYNIDNDDNNIYTLICYTYICTYIYIYMYIQREREM